MHLTMSLCINRCRCFGFIPLFVCINEHVGLMQTHVNKIHFSNQANITTGNSLNDSVLLEPEQ